MCCLPPSYSLFAKLYGSDSNTTDGTPCSTYHPGLSTTCCAISTYDVRRRSCSKSFAACGTNSFTRHKIAQRPTCDRPPQRFSGEFGSATSLSTKTQTLLSRPHFSSLPTITIPFYIVLSHILCAASKATIPFLFTRRPTVPRQLLTWSGHKAPLPLPQFHLQLSTLRSMLSRSLLLPLSPTLSHQLPASMVRQLHVHC